MVESTNLPTGKFREYKATDRESCISIFRSNIPKYFLPEEIKDFEHFLDGMAVGSYWVLMENGSVVACGGIGVRNSEGRLHYGMVSNDFHRKGVGSALIRFRLAKLVENAGVVAISLDTSQHNPEFFRRFGFEETSVKQDAYGPGLHRHDMRWELPVDGDDRKRLLKKLME